MDILYKRIFESIFEGIIVVDKDNNITLVNQEAKKLVAITDDVIGKPVFEYLHIFDVDGKPFNYLKDEQFKSNMCELETLDGFNHYINLHVNTIYNDEDKSCCGKVITFFEMNEERKRQEEILFLTYHDVLTGLHNRAFFEEELRRLDTERQLPLSVIMGDVNGLKLTNDVFGHEAGDNLLRRIARVLKSTCRHEDIIARWGGDEFILLLPKTSENQVHIIMNRIIHEIDNLYFDADVATILPSLSMGYGVKKEVSELVYETIKIAEDNMYRRKMLTNSSIYSSIISSMTNALYERSNETEAHATRLFDLCSSIGEKLNLSNAQLSELELFSRLHDIGKIGIPDDILNKPGKLDNHEWEEMKKHPEIGFRIANSTEELKRVANYILTHHERYDGSGYPKGLKGEDIPLLSRILSVVDAYDAMTHDRPYQKGISPEEAIKELNDCSGTQFDPMVVSIFNSVILQKLS